MTERSTVALVSVASARRGSAGRSLAVPLRALLLTALSVPARVLDRGAACAGLWLLLRGVVRSALVVAWRSGDSVQLRRNAAAVKAAL